MFETLADTGCNRCLLLTDHDSGLRAVLVIDSLTLGPAFGGVRTIAYASDRDAVEDAANLARAMTLKCAIANVPAGGAKTVIIDHPGLDRPKAFRKLGQYVEDLGGLYRAAGDLGTRPDDLLAMAGTTQFVATRLEMLFEAAGQGVLNCLRACVAVKGLAGVEGLTVAVQGCGAMGSATARALAKAGAIVTVADLDLALAERLAEDVGGRALRADRILEADVDVLAPCAASGLINEVAARRIRAWAICGAANNQLSSRRAGYILAERGILHVPDILSSAGAVTAGVVTDILGHENYGVYLEALGATARDVLERALADGRMAGDIAEEVALERIAATPRSAVAGRREAATRVGDANEDHRG